MPKVLKVTPGLVINTLMSECVSIVGQRLCIIFLRRNLIKDKQKGNKENKRKGDRGSDTKASI